ncbi:DUF1877 family protein [Kitasatospora sp. NPDC086009]|uniref:DUF1877 family protein n=1 Tax=unclassified Kitasatospora TaxID=2633591 RepID=UPI0037C93468
MRRSAAEPDRARARVAALDGGGAAARERLHETGRAGHVLGFLLRRHALPVDVVHGEDELPAAGDRGYGPPRCLTPEQVRAVADALTALSPGARVDGSTRRNSPPLSRCPPAGRRRTLRTSPPATTGPSPTSSGRRPATGRPGSSGPSRAPTE